MQAVQFLLCHVWYIEVVRMGLAFPAMVADVLGLRLIILDKLIFSLYLKLYHSVLHGQSLDVNLAVITQLSGDKGYLQAISQLSQNLLPERPPLRL